MDDLQKELANEVKKVEDLKQAAKRSERHVKDSGTRQLDSGTIRYRTLEQFQKAYEEAERGWDCFSDYRSPCRWKESKNEGDQRLTAMGPDFDDNPGFIQYFEFGFSLEVKGMILQGRYP